jgi:hypothetical protein
MSRIFSGIQPSGSLHIGNYLGAVKNWVDLQHKYESFFCIVDYHAITVPYAPADLRARTADMALSLLAAGLDPAKCTLFVQSKVPEHTELAWIFNTLTPLGELERQTQFKEKASKEESVPAGLLNYRCSRPPTSCCIAPSWCRSAKIRCSISSSRGRSRASGTRGSIPIRRRERVASPRPAFSPNQSRFLRQRDG